MIAAWQKMTLLTKHADQTADSLCGSPAATLVRHICGGGGGGGGGGPSRLSHPRTQWSDGAVRINITGHNSEATHDTLSTQHSEARAPQPETKAYQRGPPVRCRVGRHTLCHLPPNGHSRCIVDGTSLTDHRLNYARHRGSPQHEATSSPMASYPAGGAALGLAAQDFKGDAISAGSGSRLRFAGA